MRSLLVISVLLALLPALGGDSENDRPAPGRLKPEALIGFEELSESRQALIREALDTGWAYQLDDYIFGSADPNRGGFDCSGAVYYLLKQRGIEAPRTSAAQFEWVKRTGGLVNVSSEVRSLGHPVFSELEPGDLLFWSGTYKPSDGRSNKITHVQMYLGREVDGGAHVMIGSTDGRTYRGTARCGYGVYDFRLPRAGSKKRFVGFGPPANLERGSSGD